MNYFDPRHGTNSLRVLVTSHLAAAAVELGPDRLLPGGYAAAAAAMVLTILLMVPADAVHPPAVSTALSFAFRTEDGNSLALPSVALLVIALLVGMQWSLLSTLGRLPRPGRDRS